MRFDEFIEHIKYGECYGLALGMALRQGDAIEQSSAKKQVAAHVRQGLLEMSEKFNIFVGTQSIRVPETYSQIRITDPNYLRVLDVTSGGVKLRPYSVQDTDNWDYKSVSHGLFTIHKRLAGKVVQLLYKVSPITQLEDSTELPAPLVSALVAFVANRAHNSVGVHDDRTLSVYYARYRDALDALEDHGYTSISDLPARNVNAQGFV